MFPKTIRGPTNGLFVLIFVLFCIRLEFLQYTGTNVYPIRIIHALVQDLHPICTRWCLLSMKKGWRTKTLSNFLIDVLGSYSRVELIPGKQKGATNTDSPSIIDIHYCLVNPM